MKLAIVVGHNSASQGAVRQGVGKFWLAQHMKGLAA